MSQSFAGTIFTNSQQTLLTRAKSPFLITVLDCWSTGQPIHLNIKYCISQRIVLHDRKPYHRIRIHRRATRVGAFEVFEAAHVALRTLLAFSQPVNCIFWPIGMLNWLVAASKLHKHRVTCCTAEWPFYVFLFYGHTTSCPGSFVFHTPDETVWIRICEVHYNVGISPVISKGLSV